MNTENNTVAAKPQVSQAVVSASKWVSGQIDRLNDQFKQNGEVSSKEKEAGQKRLRQILAEQWAVISEVVSDDERMVAFTEEAIRRGINVPKGDENIFLMFVRLFAGHWNTGSTSVKVPSKPSKWVPNRSYEKYAGLFRWLHEHPEELKKFKGDVMRLIENFDGGKDVGKKTAGIMKADRNAHGGTRTVITEESFGLLHVLPAIAVIPTVAKTKNFTLSEAKIGLMMVRYNDAGEAFEILGDAKPSQAEITRYTKAFLERVNGEEALLKKASDAAESEIAMKAAQAASEMVDHLARWGYNSSAA